MNGLKMIAVPLVMISIIVGLAELGDRPGFADLVAKPCCIMSRHPWLQCDWVLLVNIIQPGAGSPLTPEAITNLNRNRRTRSSKVQIVRRRKQMAAISLTALMCCVS